MKKEEKKCLHKGMLHTERLIASDLTTDKEFVFMVEVYCLDCGEGIKKIVLKDTKKKN